MNLLQALRSPRSPVAFAGSGGKTSAVFALARDLGRAIVTTSTHLSLDQIQQADHRQLLETEADLAGLEGNLPPGVVALIGRPTPNGRVPGPPPALLDALHLWAVERSIPLLIEADGSRLRPLKAPAAHEPAIPPWAQTVVFVAGLSGLGKPLTEEWVHRPELFGRLAGLQPGEIITPAVLQSVLLHPEGGQKNIPRGARRVALLNQANTPELQSAAGRLAERLLPVFHAAIVSALNPSTGFQQAQPISSGQAVEQPALSLPKGSTFTVFEPIAGIILAAGASARLGRPKQLLDYRGQPFVRRVAQTALAAGLSPVVVVSGAHAAEVEMAVAGLPVTIARNAEWQAGMSGSVQRGVQALPEECGGAVFLLCDQPQVSAPLLRSLVELHAHTLSPLVAPLAGGQRANPVLFDRATFDDLRALRGDSGGRSLFARYRPAWLPWHDERLLWDVDTEDDYRRLIENALDIQS